MKKRLKMKITTVRERTINMPEALLRAHCLACHQEVEMLTESHAAEILQVGAAALAQLIAASHVHAIETISGSRLICKDSLLSR